MKLGFFYQVSLMVFSISLCLAGCHQEKWIPIYQGEDTLRFRHYLGIPDSSIPQLDLKKDSLGNYTEGFGYRDPLKVFSISRQNEENLIRISGQVIGGLILRDSLANYHLKVTFRWGDIKWDWMQGRPKDGGILYHQGKVRHEMQIHEGDIGSYWAKKVILDIPAVWTDQLPEAIQIAAPYLKPIVSTLTDTLLVFDQNASLHHFEGKDEWQIVLAHPYNENQHHKWNTLEVICWKNHAVHIVNGKVNMVLLNAHYYDENNVLKPLISGRLTLQSEGAEVFFKDIYYQNLTKTPEVLRAYLEDD